MRKLLLIALLSTSFVAFAQDHSAPKADPAKPASSEPVSSEHSAAAKEHGKEAGKTEEKPDVHTQLTQSPVVEKLGKTLGITTKQASTLSFFINFAIIALALFFLGKSGLAQMFRDRTAAIQRGIEEARKASEESTAKLSEIEARLSRLDEEIAQMRSEAEANGRAEEQRLTAATEEEKRKIVESAEQEITAAASNARRDLKAFAAELAVGLAEKKIAVNEATDKTLIRDFSQGLTDGRKGGA